MDLLFQYWWLLCVEKCNTRKLLCGLVHASLCSSPHTVLDHLQDILECYLHLLHLFSLCRLNLWWLSWVSTRVILIADTIDLSACVLSKMFSWWILPTMALCPKYNTVHRFLVQYIKKTEEIMKYLDKSMHDFQSYRSKQIKYILTAFVSKRHVFVSGGSFMCNFFW